MAFCGNEQFGGLPVAAAQAAQDRNISIAAGGTFTFDELQTNQLTKLSLYLAQSGGDALALVSVQVKTAREWRTIDVFTVPAIGAVVKRDYAVVSHKARVFVDYTAGAAVSASGWFILSAMGV